MQGDNPTWAKLGFDGHHYWVQQPGLPRRLALSASVHVPDLTEEGVEPNPGWAARHTQSFPGLPGAVEAAE
eukprot:2113509-Amphidinium_carterae.3